MRNVQLSTGSMWTGSRCSSPTTSSTPSSMSTCSSTRGHWTRGYAAFLRVIEHHAPLPCFCGRGALILCAVLRALCQSRPTQTWQAKGNTCSLGAPRWARSKSTHATAGQGPLSLGNALRDRQDHHHPVSCRGVSEGTRVRKACSCILRRAVVHGCCARLGQTVV